MKHSALIDKLIREEIANVRKQQVLEQFFLDSQYNPEFEKKLKDPANRNKSWAKPWANKPLESALKYLGAKPISNGLNPYGYELDVDLGISGVSDVAGTKQYSANRDRLNFSSDATVWSSNARREMYCTVKNNVIMIWYDASHTKQAGTISKTGGKAVYTSSSKTPVKMYKGDTGSQILDAIQTTVDWATLMLSPFFPGASDLLDGVNAMS